MATQKKIDTVKKLTDKISSAKSVVFADYTGLTHKQLEELRRNLKKVEAEFVVLKNKLMVRALGDTAESVKGELTHATAALFSYRDEVSGLKELLKFFKTAAMGKTKGGMLSDKAISTQDVLNLSVLPGREVLIARLAGQLNAPIQGLHRALQWNMLKLVYALDAVKGKKS